MKFSFCKSSRTFRAGFSLVELLVVIAIIVMLATMAVPAIRSMGKSNDRSQAANLVRSMISSARAIALSQHRMAGVVFFEESSQYSKPANANQTAMQLFVEDYNQVEFQQQWGQLPNGATGFVAYSAARQYLPQGIKLAALSDIAGNNVETGDTSNGLGARVVLFDANGNLLNRGFLAAPTPQGTVGTYPMAYGDWKFGNAPGITNAYSSPGFFLYNKLEYDAQPAANRVAWLRQNTDVIVINVNTGVVETVNK